MTRKVWMKPKAYALTAARDRQCEQTTGKTMLHHSTESDVKHKIDRYMFV